jgi:hypothetical protein
MRQEVNRCAVFYVEGLLAEAEKLCQLCLGIELHGANDSTSKHTPKRAHSLGRGRGLGDVGILYIFSVSHPVPMEIWVF